MSDIRFNTWLHQSGTGGITQVDGGHVGIGTTNPDIAVHTANAKKVNVGIVTANSVYAGNYYGNGSNLTGVGHVDKIIEGDTKVEVFDAGSQYISAEVNGSEKVRIDSSGRVIIGDTDTDNAFSGGDSLVIGNTSARSGITLVSSTSNDGGLYFSKGTSNDQVRGQIVYQHDSNGGYMRFYTNADERLRIDSSGNVGLNGITNPSSYDGWGRQLVLGSTTGHGGLTIVSGNDSGEYGHLLFADGTGGTPDQEGRIGYEHNSNFMYFATNNSERLRIMSDGRFGFGTNSPSSYALATFNSANGIQLQGDGQSRILMRNNTGGTNEKMMDIQCNGNINIRTINDNYTTATTRATFRTDGNFVVGNRVGTSSPSTNQPVAFHSARVTPDTASSTLSNGVRCNLYVGSNTGWAAGDGGVIGMGGSRAGYAGQEAMWAYIKGSRISGNGWEYAGKMELGTAEWGTYNTTKAVTIYGDNQIDHHGKDNTMYSASIGGAVRVRLQHNGGGNMTLSNPSSGNFTFDTNSDYRLKENVVNITNALTTVKALKPYQYKWKHDGKLGQGFIAHEAQEVLPDVGIVSGTKDAVHAEDDPEKGHWKKDDPIYQGIDYSKLVPLLTAALQEESAKREALEARVAALEGS